MEKLCSTVSVELALASTSYDQHDQQRCFKSAKGTAVTSTED